MSEEGLARAQRWLDHTRAEGISLGVKDCYCPECMHYTHEVRYHDEEEDEDMTTENATGIHKAICAIKLAIAGGGGIGKGKRAPMGYMFRGIEDFDNVLCGLSAEHHIAGPYPRILTKEIIHGTTAKGGYQSHAIVEIEWTYVCELDGSSQVCSTVGEAMDTQDKAFNKAMQAARKYADIMVYRIPIGGDDTEVYVPDPGAQQAPQEAAPAAVTEPAKRTRGPNKPKEEPAPVAQQQATSSVQQPPPPPAPPPAQITHPQTVLDAAYAGNGNGMPFPTVPDMPPSDISATLARIKDVNTFPLLYSFAQDTEERFANSPNKMDIFNAIKLRAADLFNDAKNMAEVQEGFSLVTALGQPTELRTIANKAFARFRVGVAR